MIDNAKQPLVSVIVPVYKVEQYLDRCIQSMEAQKYTHWELILVDDGSPDRCPKICNEWAKRDDRIKVIHKKNGGQASARNAALDVIKGEYMMYLDSDDYLHADTLYDTVSILQKENADIVQFSFVRGVETLFPKIKKKGKYKIYDHYSVLSSNAQKIIMPAKLYKTELWDGIRMPEGKLNYEDDATTWKVYYRANKIVVLKTPYYYYTINPNSTMAIQHKAMSLAFIPAYQERIAFFEKENDKLLTDLSKWRFCLPLMLGYMRGNVRKDDLPVLLKYFYENNKAAICCSKVRFEHRVLIALFSCCPWLFRKLFVLLGKAHTLD